MNRKSLIIIVSIMALLSVALLFHTMKMKLITSPRILCKIRSSCGPTTATAETFRYPESMAKNIIVTQKEGSMDCVALLEESKQCLNQHLQDMMAGAPADYLASSATKCFNLINMGQQCILSSPSPTVDITPFMRSSPSIQMPETSAPSMPASMDFQDEDAQIASLKKRVRFQDEIQIDPSAFDMPTMFDDSFSSQGPSLPMPLVDLTQIYNPQQQTMDVDASVECINVNGKTYCQVREMI